MTDVGKDDGGLEKGEVDFIVRGVDPVQLSRVLTVRGVPCVIITVNLGEVVVLFEAMPSFSEVTCVCVGTAGGGSVFSGVFYEIKIAAHEEVAGGLHCLLNEMKLSLFHFEVVGPGRKVGVN